MLYVVNESTDPYFNLALEEYLLTRRTDLKSLFMLWQDEPVVVVGRNQNSTEEINRDFMKKKGIKLVRRLSGGGAVYHDLGNLNFTFISEDNHDRGLDFSRFTRPVIETLQKIGIKAENNGRNDITIAGKKFSGNAQYRYNNRLLHHGTLLFASNLEDMTEALRAGDDKLQNKGIKSVRSRVTNIIDHLNAAISIDEFKNYLKSHILKDPSAIYYLTPSDKEEINRLRQDKYLSWAWNYGKSPGFNLKKSQRFDWGKIECCLEVRRGVIKSCLFYGDFFFQRDIKELADLLINQPYRREVITELLNSLDLNSYIINLEAKQLMDILF